MESRPFRQAGPCVRGYPAPDTTSHRGGAPAGRLLRAIPHRHCSRANSSGLRVKVRGFDSGDKRCTWPADWLHTTRLIDHPSSARPGRSRRPGTSCPIAAECSTAVKDRRYEIPFQSTGSGVDTTYSGALIVRRRVASSGIAPVCRRTEEASSFHKSLGQKGGIGPVEVLDCVSSNSWGIMRVDRSIRQWTLRTAKGCITSSEAG